MTAIYIMVKCSIIYYPRTIYYRIDIEQCIAFCIGKKHILKVVVRKS